jgi:hypothetical protein
MQFTTPSQDAGMNDSVLHRGWDTHSSALGLQTQQVETQRRKAQY